MNLEDNIYTKASKLNEKHYMTHGRSGIDDCPDRREIMQKIRALSDEDCMKLYERLNVSHPKSDDPNYGFWKFHFKEWGVDPAKENFQYRLIDAFENHLHREPLYRYAVAISLDEIEQQHQEQATSKSVEKTRGAHR